VLDVSVVLQPLSSILITTLAADSLITDDKQLII